MRGQKDQDIQSPLFSVEPSLAMWAKASALLDSTAEWWELGHTQTPGLVSGTISVGSQTVPTRCIKVTRLFKGKQCHWWTGNIRYLPLKALEVPKQFNTSDQ